MSLRAALAVSVFWTLSAPARARAYVSPPYDAKAAALDDLSRELLTDNGYELRDDGVVWDKIGETAVTRDDMPYLLSRLASARRLHALLQINNIINRYDAERKLTAEDREAVRTVARRNWVVFGLVPRRDFRPYFSIEELETLDKISPRFDSMSPVTMTDPSPESPTAAPPSAAPAVTPAIVPAVVPAAAAAVTPVAAAPAPAAPAKAVPSLIPMADMPSLKRESPFAPAVPIASATFVAAPAAPPAVATAVAPQPRIAPPPPATPDLGMLKPWTPPAASDAAVAKTSAAVVAAAPAPAPPPPAPEPPKPRALDASDYEKFVAEGPYTKDGRALLDLIGKRAPDYCLPLLRRTVVNGIPQIAFDGARTGSALRAALLRDPASPQTPPVVALSPGPVFLVAKKGLFGSRREVVLPESPDAWTDLGTSRPALDAFTGVKPAAAVENGDWGAVRVYADGSRRGAYSQIEQAGELLEQLLLLGLAREGLDASPYAARRWARAARLMFSARMKDEMRQDGFLDPDRRAELRAWLDRPEEADDATTAVWAGSRVQLYDPRRGPPDAERVFEARSRIGCVRSALENALVDAARKRARRVGALETLADAGALDSAAAKAAAKAAADEENETRRRLLSAPPACRFPDPQREEALKKSVLLCAEAARAERAQRERKDEGSRRAL